MKLTTREWVAKAEGDFGMMVLGGGYSSDAWRVQYQSITNILERYGDTSPARVTIRGRRRYPKK